MKNKDNGWKQIFMPIVMLVVLCMAIAVFFEGFAFFDAKIQSYIREEQARTALATTQVKNYNDIPEIHADIVAIVRYRGFQTFGFVIKLPGSDIVYICAEGSGMTPILNSNREPMRIGEYEQLIEKDGA